MAWSAIAAAEVLEEFNPKEQAKIAEQQGAADNLTPILGRVVNMVRGSIVAGGGRLDANGTVPDQLREDVIAIARWRWLISLPGVEGALEMQSKPRQQAHDDAMKRMDDVAAGKVKIEVPAAPIATVSPSNAVEVASSQVRVATAAKMDGLA